jgi:serine/threonine protein phosphatase 1
MTNEKMTYAIGDLHGEITLLRRLLATLPFREEDTLVFLGDYLDRGEDSIATILELFELKRRHPNCIFLRGNHDDVWLSQWDGVRFLQPPDIDGALDVWDRCDGQIPFKVGYWLEETRIDYEDEYAYYVHAGLTPGKTFERTADFFKLWGVQGFLWSKDDWGKPVVFGHWQMPQPLIQPAKIGIDTGAYQSGVLTAVRLPDRQIFQVRR